MKSSIGKKMNSSFSIILLFVIIALVFVVVVSNVALSKSKVLANEKFPQMRKMDELKLAIYGKRVLFDQYLTSKKTKILDILSKKENNIQKTLGEIKYDKKEFNKLYNQYNKMFDDIIKYIKKNPTKLSVAMRKTANADKFFNDKLVPVIDKMLDQNQKQTDDLVKQLQASLKNSQLLFIIIGLVIIILGYLLSSKLTKNLSTPIKSLTKVTDKISMGDFEIDINIKTDDEIEELANAIDRMKRSLQKAMERLMNR